MAKKHLSEQKKSKMEFIYKKETDLDDQNNFLVDLAPKNAVDGNYFKEGKGKGNFSIIKQISDRFNKAKKG